MSGWSIARRINTITLALSVCTVLVGVLGVAALLRIGGLFLEYRSATQTVLIAVDVFEDMIEAEMAELRFRKTHAPDLVDEVIDNLDDIEAAKPQLLAGLEGDAQLTQLADKVFGEEASFRDAFTVMQARQADREAAAADLPAQWQALSDSLNTLDTQMMFVGNQRVAANLDVAAEAILNGRIHLERYLFRNTAEEIDAARAAFGTAAARLADSTAILESGNVLAMAEAAGASLAAYVATIERVAEAIDARNHQRDILDVLALSMLNDIETIVETVAARQALLGERSERLRGITLIALLIAAVLAVVLGILLARRIAGDTTRSIDAAVAATREIADGNLDTVIPGTEHDHELGQMSRALEVLRDNGRAAEALRAEQEAQKRETARREAETAEREAAMEAERVAKMEETRQAMIRELTQSVGTVVSAGADGDFSRRIDATFDSDALNELASGINALVANVEAGVAETARVMGALAEGNLSDRMTGTFHGTFATLQSNVNETIEHLSELVTQIAGQCDMLARSAGQMSTQAGDLSRRAEQQAASLEETSAAMEQISASAKSSADGAMSAAEFARKTSAQVDEAGKVVSSAIGAMADIRDASGRINDIVAVIDGIAFQTNLLALNASVEAARAGSAGKGFAVVATEVRALAQRSGEASKGIKALIGESTGQVERGVTLVEQTGATLDDIMGGVSRMARTMQDLTTSAREQATGVGEVTAAITQLDAITQKNAAVSDESRNTAVTVQTLSDAIREMVARFRLQEMRGPSQGNPNRAVAAE